MLRRLYQGLSARFRLPSPSYLWRQAQYQEDPIFVLDAWPFIESSSVNKILVRTSHKLVLTSPYQLPVP
ncbi:hypothetical protein PISMIDRAFT_641690 [Pisolithus microcarpus 441]|uniref:Uncharacterized protein n=1 Tax=Pisolithus microcarpus 441 TaxID=765257 RepID=A0A0C9YEG7_9AGAM|nr:hypothetical protein PISMIDRAFT_641690 [Pisolithus microcarpus 441]